MWFNKSVATINAMLKILDITRLIYIYIYIFGFRIGTLNLNMSFPLHASVQKWTEVDQNESNWSKWTKVNTNGPNGTKWTKWTK